MDLYFEQGYPANSVIKMREHNFGEFQIATNEKSVADIFCERPSGGGRNFALNRSPLFGIRL